jgi:broad specificity phosphatase PhoE
MASWMFLLRHGATRLNLEKPYRLQGLHQDTPLAPEGREQVCGGRDWLRGIPLRAVYTSPLLRARETAEIVASPQGLPITVVPLLHEGSVGSWENRTWDEIKASEPEAYARFMSDPATQGYDGGDNFTQVFERVRPVFDELLARHEGEHFAVVGHQITNRVYIADLLGMPLKEARRLKFANGGVSIIKQDRGERTLVSLNIAWPHEE